MRRAAFVIALMVSTFFLSSGAARAGVPFINLEGVGGVAFNPVAYPAAEAEERSRRRARGDDGSAPKDEVSPACVLLVS